MVQLAEVAFGPHCTSEQFPTGWESTLPTMHLSDWKSSSKSLRQAASTYTDDEQQWPTHGASAASEVPVGRIICQPSPSKLEVSGRGSEIAPFHLELTMQHFSAAAAAARRRAAISAAVFWRGFGTAALFSASPAETTAACA